MTQTSSIRIDSCRSDGRCPECGADPVSAYAKQPMACGCLSSGAHCWETACAARHLNALLTEALRQRDEHYFKGIKDVRMIRCMAHHKVPAFNSMEANGGECAVCVVDDIGKARDATIREVEQWKGKAIRVSGEADALERERDEARASRNTLILDLNCARAQATVVEEKAERAESEVKTLRLLVDSQTEQISRSAMDLYAAVQSEVAAEKRSEKAEEERDEAQAKLVEEREAMASISGELVQAQVKVAKERDSYRAALEECRELRSEAMERAERAEALLQECQDAVRIAASAEEDHGALDRARELDALAAQIREVLG